MYCLKCGSTIPDDSNFCELCGSPVKDQNKPPAPPRRHTETPTPKVINPQPPSRPVDKPTSDLSGGYEEIMTVKDWIIMFILLAIPLLNFFLIIVWAIGGNVNKNKQNYVRAMIILTIIFSILAGLTVLVLFLVSLIFGGEFLSFMG